MYLRRQNSEAGQELAKAQFARGVSPKCTLAANQIDISLDQRGCELGKANGGNDSGQPDSSD
jgi:hypothetical protein